MAMARKCGSCHTNSTAKKKIPREESPPVAVAHPIAGGIAPAIAPTGSDHDVRRFIGV